MTFWVITILYYIILYLCYITFRFLDLIQVNVHLMLMHVNDLNKFKKIIVVCN